MSSVSPLVVRGMGSSPKLITRGYGTLAVVEKVAKAAEEVGRRLQHGRSRTKDLYETKIHHYVLKAMLISINDNELSSPISNTEVKSIVETDPPVIRIAEIVIRYLKSPAMSIFITVKKIVRGR